MWKNEILVWEDTPSSKWNNFGEITEIPDICDDDLYAKGVVIWRKTTLNDFVENTISLLESGNGFLENKNILTGAMLVISIISFAPLHIEIIKDDDVADKFLSLIKREESQHYILKEELEKSEFGKVKSLNTLIADLINDGVLTEIENKYYIDGEILSSVHLWESNSD